MGGNSKPICLCARKSRTGCAAGSYFRSSSLLRCSLTCFLTFFSFLLYLFLSFSPYFFSLILQLVLIVHSENKDTPQLLYHIAYAEDSTNGASGSRNYFKFFRSFFADSFSFNGGPPVTFLGYSIDPECL